MEDFKKPKNADHVAEEDDLYERFEREYQVDIDALNALVAAREHHPDGGLAARTYDQLILNFIGTSVDITGLDFNRPDLTEDEESDLYNSDELGAFVVMETNMLQALRRLIAALPNERQDHLSFYLECMYSRWKYLRCYPTAESRH